MGAHRDRANLSFRLATLSDAPLASRLVIAGWRDSYAGFLPASLLDGLDGNEHHDVASWRARIAAASARTWIVSDDGEAIGVARLELGGSVPGTRSELTTLYIGAACRGRGIGVVALQFVSGEASRLDALPTGLCVLSGNARGRRFFERHGARPVGEREVFNWNRQTIMETMYVVEI